MSPDVTPASEAAFHAQVLLLVQRWHRLGLIDAPTRQVLLRYQRARIEGLLAPPPEVPPTPAAPPIVHPEPDAPAATDPVPSSPATGARAPTPPPRPRPPATDTPFPLPARPRREGRSTAAVLGSFLRERTWWLVGAGLTVVGSFFVAGTLWSDLGTAPRLLLVLAGLALYAQAFASAGHRIRRQPEGRRAGTWLLGVSVALAPVLAMAAGSGWALGGLEGLLFTAPALLAVVLLLAWRLRRDLPALLPSCDAGFRWIYLTLCATVGLLPALPSPFWLILPAGLAGAGLWWALTRWRRLPPGAALLLLHPIAFHLYLAPHGSSGAYAPALAVAALAVLYLDAALGRWRGLHAQRLRGLRGVAALALAGASLALLAPGLRPLPSGPESAVVGLLLVPFFLGAALCWRRPALIHGALLAALLFTLALPDLFHAIVELFSAAARQALGYDDEPLPLAWYSLTLLPLLLVTRASAAGLGRSGWRQAAALREHAWRWTFALSGLLLLAAHSRPDDLRPALLALPLHGLLWLRERRVRALLRGTLPWAIPLLWTVDLLWHTGVAPSWRLGVAAALTLALIPAGATLARRLAETALLEGARIVAVAAALLLPLVLGGWEEPATALMLAGATTWLVSLGLRPLRAPPSAALYQLESALAVLGQTMLVGGLLCWAVPLGVGPLAWAGGLVGLAFCAAALAWWLPRVRARSEASAAALEVWAHTLALAAVVALCWLDGWDRSLMKLPIAALLVWWLTLRRWRVYGALLVFGLCEAVVRRLWLADALEPGGLAVVATALCWLPAALLIAAKRAEPRFAIHWLHRSLGQPAAWLGALCALAALPALLLQRPPGHGGQLAALALVTMLLLASRAAPTRAVELERSGWIAALACAVAWTLSEPVALLLPWLVPLPPALALLALLRPAPHRLELAAAAALAALLCGLVLGPLGHPELLATGAAGATLLALRRSRGWTQAALLSWLALAHSALAAQIAPSLGGHLVLISASSALLWAMLHAGPAPLRPAARQLGLGTAIAGAAGWSLWCATLAPQDLLAGWPVGLAAATLLLLAHRQGAAARLLAPWAISALLLSGGADPVLHPIAWLGFATVAWLLSPRAGADRVGTRLLAGLALAGLLVAAVLRPELRPLLAFPVAATGLLAAQTGAGHRWAWGALALALLTAAAVEPLEPVAVLLRASLAFTAVAGLRHVAPEDAAPTPRGLLWLTITVAIGLSSGAWAISGLALVAGGLLLLRARWCLTTRGPALLEEPAGWLLLAGAVASRAWDQGSQAELTLLALAVPALAWSLPRPWLFLASLPLLAWLPGELLQADFTVAWPTSLAALSLLTIALGERVPGGAHARHWLPALAAGAALLCLLDRGVGPYALLAAPLALAFWLTERRSVALAQLCAALVLLSGEHAGLASGLPALLLLLCALAARGLGARWLELVAGLVLLPALFLEGNGHPEIDPSGWQLLVLAGAFTLSVARTAALDRPERWYATAAWGAGLYLALRVFGPLHDLPPRLELPLLLGVGLLLELAASALEPRRGEPWVRPLRHGTLAIVAIALLAALLLGGATSIGLALAGCLLCLRYVLRERRLELVLGVLLLDVATVMLEGKLGWTDPIAWVGPTGLSLLVLAQILRQSLDPRVRELLRWAGACSIFLTALGQAVFDPAWTLGLVAISLAGLALGSLLRVRSFLLLGGAFLGSALITELLRFGLANAQFWAFYLTSIGLFILAGMVVLSVYRPRLAQLGQRWRERTQDWE